MAPAASDCYGWSMTATFNALTTETMLAMMLAEEAATTADGRFIVAVKTTGIYCLPSCRPPRRPKHENLEFFPGPEEARAAGYRACKRCRPDDFYLGHHASEELAEQIVGAARNDPGAYRSVADLASHGGVSQTKLHDLIRTHFHTTPADVLVRARVVTARTALLASDRSVAEVAYGAGFESLSAFNDNFRKLSGLSPQAYRGLASGAEFVLNLPADYPIERMLRYFGRDAESVTDRVTGNAYSTALRLGNGDPSGTVAVATIELRPGAARCRLDSSQALTPVQRGVAHEQILAMLGLALDPTRFESHVSASPELAPLIAGQTGLRLPRLADPFDALVWAITGQQISLAFTYRLRRRLVELTGFEMANGLYAPPLAERVAELECGDLTALSFSRSKADYLIGAARAVVDGSLPIYALTEASATRVERTLLAVRGIGPWSAHYLLMRAYGFLDCVPVGDTGLVAGLTRFFSLPTRPDSRETLALMSRFSPYRSLATFHLWQRHGTAA